MRIIRLLAVARADLNRINLPLLSRRGFEPIPSFPDKATAVIGNDGDSRDDEDNMNDKVYDRGGKHNGVAHSGRQHKEWWMDTLTGAAQTMRGPTGEVRMAWAITKWGVKQGRGDQTPISLAVLFALSLFERRLYNVLMEDYLGFSRLPRHVHCHASKRWPTRES